MKKQSRNKKQTLIKQMCSELINLLTKQLNKYNENLEELRQDCEKCNIKKERFSKILLEKLNSESKLGLYKDSKEDRKCKVRLLEYYLYGNSNNFLNTLKDLNPIVQYLIELTRT